MKDVTTTVYIAVDKRDGRYYVNCRALNRDVHGLVQLEPWSMNRSEDMG